MTDQFLAEIESEFEPTEILIAYATWFFPTTKEVVLLNGDRVEHPTSKFVFTVVTDERLYTFGLNTKMKLWGQAVAPVVKSASLDGTWNYIELGKVGQFEFFIQKSKGQVLGYKFGYFGDFGSWLELQSYDVDEATTFKEAFEARSVAMNSVNAVTDMAAQIGALAELRKEGILTEEEFVRAKEAFIGKTPDAQQQAERNLRSLKQLRDSGVLSEAEFRAKKWESLSG
jgi:hypothetical protein